MDSKKILPLQSAELRINMNESLSIPFTLPYSVIFWFTYFLVFWISEFAAVKPSKKPFVEEGRIEQDSLAFLSILTIVSQLVSLTFAWCGVGDLPNSYFLFFCFGILFMYLGAGLRQHSFKQLGGAFTIDVRVSKQQKVIDSGAYRYIRHPGYLAGILMMLGFGVAMSNLVAVVVMFSTSVFVYSRRIHFEEKAMLEQLGSNYSNYIKNTKKLIPLLY